MFPMSFWVCQAIYQARASPCLQNARQPAQTGRSGGMGPVTGRWVGRGAPPSVSDSFWRLSLQIKLTGEQSSLAACEASDGGVLLP
ncbi:hypothetical protein HDV57DRAFT_495083 [Trichoderma longibrachiatum]